VAFDDLRRLLGRTAGFTPAATASVGSEGRPEEAATRPARVEEAGPFTARPVGAAIPCPEPIAFLDGIQRQELLGHVRHTLPVFAADIAVAVRERRGRQLTTVTQARERLLVGRPEALDPLSHPAGYTVVALPDNEPAHPLLDRDRARAGVDRARATLEARLAERWRDRSTAWLIVDGALAELGPMAGDPRTIGVSKSHAVLPFDGGELAVYLGLPAGHRSPVFQPAAHGQAAVYSWGLRLRDWTGEDVFFGLVRVEAALTDETLSRADEYSRWLLAERAPVSAPDARWDRLLYGIRNVEDYLRATLPAR
jgi:hypothetical protein